MTNDQSSSQASDTKPSSFSARLKSARDALGLERKDVAAQLRLNEKIILMMEKDKYPLDLPVTFIRGYLRSYSKLLQIPDFELKTALENIKPRPVQSFAPLRTIPMPMGESVQGNPYFMQFFTFLVLITLASLVGIWWYNHGTASPPMVENQTSAALTEPPLTPPQEAMEMAANSTPPASLKENPLDRENNIKDHRSPAKVAMGSSKKSIKETDEEETSDTHSEQIETVDEDAD